MKVLFTSLMLLVLVTATAFADGTVCVDAVSTNGSWEGNNTGATPASMFKVQIDDLPSQTISTNSSGAFTNLNVNAKHIIKITINDKPYASFWFSFKDKGSDHLRLWYKEFYGTWQLWQSGSKHKCEYLKKEQVAKEISTEMQKASKAFKTKDYSTAESHFKTVVNLKPYFAECWVGLGMCLAKQGKNDEAKRAFEKALSIHQKRYKQSPKDYNELWQQVIVLIFLNRKSEADTILKIGIKKFPDRPEFKESMKKLIDVRAFLNKNGEE